MNVPGLECDSSVNVGCEEFDMDSFILAICELLTSKKGLAAIVAFVMVISKSFGVPINEETLMQLLGILGTYIIGQGIADLGKSAAKITARDRWDN